ncbi:Autophagy-related protein 17 [Escovopsis weberi]|uniref:Autophagy-related protein 17 n=1 Tax=Escovopsis weberi TaxID=150374 RepID=A0A0M8N2E0_ESCWE|nr:Autophagy-related protein 17 [Escovopsis weberi]
MSSRRSPGSSAASLRRPSVQHHKYGGEAITATAAISVDTLVNHLLAAKRSLSSMTLVLRADELITAARLSHEDTVVMAAQSAFLRGFVADQIRLLAQIRMALQRTYDWGKRDFKKLVRSMDEVDGELTGTMEMLRETAVHRVLGAKGEERKNLLDFVDEGSVTSMRESMKRSIQELQAIQSSFDGDLLRLENDIKSLNKILADALGPPVTQAIGLQMMQLYGHSTSMADCLASLTRHFDLCVTAIRSTEGAAALARRKAAEITRSQGGESVSISGVITEQESAAPDLEPQTSEERANMLQVVSEDAQLVEGVVREIQDHLSEVEFQYGELGDLAQQSRKAYLCMLDAYASLGDVEARLDSYIAAEEDFRTRWALEKEAVFKKLGEMREMRDFYDRYASAYGGLLLEVERRRTVEAKVLSVWRKAQESVDKILEVDRTSRELFRNEVGEFLPTDLWAGMQASTKRWKVCEVSEGEGGAPDSIHTLGAPGQADESANAVPSTAAGDDDGAEEPGSSAPAPRNIESSRTSQDTAKRKPSHNRLRPTG